MYARALVASLLIAMGCASSFTPPEPPEACGDGTFDRGDAGVGDGGRACSPWSDCPSGTYVSEEGSAARDRRCEPCAPGSFSTSTNAPSCTRWTPCPMGAHRMEPGTRATDQTCAACEEGSFSAEPDAAACEPWSSCPTGTIVASEGSATADRSCQPCPPGMGSWDENQTHCVELAACLPGSVEVTPGTATTPPLCEACAVGEFCAGGTASRVPCGDGSWDDDRDPTTACVAWSTCEAGSYVAAPGSASADRVCRGCVSGSFSLGLDSESCAEWTRCVAGEYVLTAPGPDRDRVCAPCPEGSFSDGPNRSRCLPLGVCDPGTVETTPGTSGSAPVCEACSAGEYCAGGASPREACGAGRWDDDDDPATACVPRTTCVAGSYVLDAGDATHDRVCAPCAEGSFSAEPNRSACAPWSDCEAGTLERRSGSITRDRVCVLSHWPQQFGSREADSGEDVQVAVDGSVYVVGWTNGALPGQELSGPPDAFVRKYDLAGVELWTRQFGLQRETSGQRVGVDAVGNVYVGGHTSSGLGGAETFLRKYDASGRMIWTRSFSGGNQRSLALQVDLDGNLYLADITYAALPGQTHFGGVDVFVRKYDSAGREVWTRQFGSERDEFLPRLKLDPHGDVYVSGSAGGRLSGSSISGRYLRKYDANGELIWTRISEAFGEFAGVDAEGNVYFAGDTVDALPGYANAGLRDVIVRKFDPMGAIEWNRQFGSDRDDVMSAAHVDASGNVYVAGTSPGVFPDATIRIPGSGRLFARAYDSSGAALWTARFGVSPSESAKAIIADARGTAFVTGRTLGFRGTRSDDAYVFRIGR